MKSRPCRIGKHLFRYNYEWHTVEEIAKADPEMIEDNREWQEKYGRDLWEIDEAGYIELRSVGLSEENWKNKEARLEYLEMWAAELEEEDSYMIADFVKHELPLYTK